MVALFLSIDGESCLPVSYEWYEYLLDFDVFIGSINTTSSTKDANTSPPRSKDLLLNYTQICPPSVLQQCRNHEKCSYQY